jgi:hypothetical protein
MRLCPTPGFLLSRRVNTLKAVIPAREAKLVPACRGSRESFSKKKKDSGQAGMTNHNMFHLFNCRSNPSVFINNVARGVGCDENGHSWRLRRFPEIIDKSGMNYINGYFCGYVNQENNSPILWRFSARPTQVIITTGFKGPCFPASTGTRRAILPGAS